MLIHTRYVASSVALLLGGTLVCLATCLMAVMTAGFGADPVHDFRSGAIVCVIFAALLATPFYLAMFRWCRIGCVGVWCMAALSLLLALVTGMAGPTMAFAILLGLQGLICSGIVSISENRRLG